MRRILIIIACAGTCAVPAASSVASAAQPSIPSSNAVRAASALSQQRALAAHRGQARRILAITNALGKIRALRAECPTCFETETELPGGKWFVVYYQQPRINLPANAPYYQQTAGLLPKEKGQVTLDHSGRVLEAWTGIQDQWVLARGETSLFGKHVNALYVWLPLCLLFVLPFFNFRRPFSLLHLDLLVLLSFSVSLAFFNHADIHASVPLVYPPLIYLLARTLALMRPGRVGAEVRPLRLLVPAPWLALVAVLLIGFRIALNVTDSTVIDVGSAGPIGAQRIVDGLPLYGEWPPGEAYQDNYGPVIYETYVPLNQVFGFSPARANQTLGFSAPRANQPVFHGATILFDLLAVAMSFLLGRRVRGPTLGIALAYAWVSFPFTSLALANNSNDALIATLLLAALLAATYRSKIAGATRGVLAALAGLTKFAPLAAAPVLATHGLGELPPSRRPYALAVFLAGFLGTAALVFVPALSHSSLHTFWERTIVSTAKRETPFSVWGLYGGLGGLQLTVRIAAIVLGLSLAVIPRRPDVVGLAAACAAAIVAVQLADGYWFYFYILWFFPLVMLALLGHFSVSEESRAPASEPVRSSRHALAA